MKNILIADKLSKEAEKIFSARGPRRFIFRTSRRLLGDALASSRRKLQCIIYPGDYQARAICITLHFILVVLRIF